VLSMRLPRTLSDFLQYVVLRPYGSLNGRSTHLVRELATMEDYEAFVNEGLGGVVLLRPAQDAR
jgi:hypothetical protein